MLQDELARIHANLLGLFKAGKFKKIKKLLSKDHEYGLLRFDKNQSILHLAIMYQNPDLVDFVLSVYPELITLVDDENSNPFHYAVEFYKNIDCIHILLTNSNARALIHQRNTRGASPLQMTIASDNQRLFEVFKDFIFHNPVKHPEGKAVASLAEKFSKINITESKLAAKQAKQRRMTKSEENLAAIAQIQSARTKVVNLSNRIDSILLTAGFEAFSATPERLQDNPVWNLCAGLNPFMLTKSQIESGESVLSERSFDKDVFLNRLHGILSQMSEVSIVDNILALWRDFDNSKKLTAIYFIKEILVWDVDNRLFDKQNELQSSINKVMQQVCDDFQPHGHSLAVLINNIIKVKRDILTNQDCKELKEARNKTQRSTYVKTLESFDALLEATSRIQKEKVQRQYTARIAAEFTTIMLAFYHNVDVSEFYNAAWTSQDKTIAPHIKRHIRIMNRLGAYIQTFILSSQTKEICAARISLMIRVASHLCEPIDGVGPDLGSVVLINQALDSFAISRLKPCFALLSEQDSQKLQDIKKLAAPLNGYGLMKEVAQASRLPIINPGLFQQQVTLAYESPLDKHEVLGKVLRNVLQLKQDLQTKSFQYETDLLHHLVKGSFVSNSDEAEFYSGRFVPLVLDYMPFAQVEKLVCLIIDEKMEPTVFFEQTLHHKAMIVKPILEKLKKCVTFKEDVEDAQNLLGRSRDLAKNLIEFCNNKYDGNLSEALTDAYLPEPSPILSLKFTKKRSWSFDSTKELESPPVDIVQRSPEKQKKYSTEKMESPKRVRKRIPI